MTRPREVAPGVHQLGNTVVNWYLVVDGGRCTVIDAGTPAQFDQLVAVLTSVGRSLAVVEAVLLTHAHADHTGTAERLRTEAPAPVHVHERDAAVARGEATVEREGSLIPYLVRPAAWRTIWTLTREGGARIPPIVEVTTFADDDVLDVPGRPRILHVPGHTDGNCALELADGVVATGDAIVTWNPLTGRRGPQIMPSAFNTDSAQALDSLDRLVGRSATTLLPGHGEVWSGPVGDAVAAARRAGRS